MIGGMDEKKVGLREQCEADLGVYGDGGEAEREPDTTRVAFQVAVLMRLERIARGLEAVGVRGNELVYLLGQEHIEVLILTPEMLREKLERMRTGGER
jgi:hypothetical protein